MTLLEVHDLDVRFATPGGVVRAVDGVSLSLRAGETLAIVGESGCGKSTLARTIVGIERAHAGQLHYAGRALPTAGPERRALARELQLIFQDPDASLNPRMTIGSAVTEPLIIHRPELSRGERRQAVDVLLRRVGIDPLLFDRYPHELSGGQRQRVCIARALSLEPRLLILDEAVSALDVSIRAQILNLLVELQRSLGLTYLFITHDLGVVRHIAHRVAVMYLGQIVEEADTDALFERPEHPYTRALLGAVLRVDADAQRPTPGVSGDVPSPLRPPSGCRFHTRCPLVFERCRNEAPAHYVLDEGAVGASAGERRVRCFLVDPSRPAPRGEALRSAD
ncbi:MAG TPA: oligopeptide/dipeptide ABC transporter ATP-binding protein [Polyangiaceae bacterium]|nr:oligopeptide/dipeptide ABC transporter ATP-binding protein [Polyangiaceae bacterium]